MAKILITEDEDSLRKFVARALRLDGHETSEAADGEQGLEMLQEDEFDLLLSDIRMPVMDGITAGQHLLKADPAARLIYLTTFLEDDYIVDALRLGAKGYLMKTDFESLLPAFDAVMKGQRVFGDEIVAKIPTYIQAGRTTPRVPLPALNAMETQLVFWIAEGLNNKEIAEKMHFSEGTIRNYLSTILEKLKLRDRTQVAIYYFKNLE